MQAEYYSWDCSYLLRLLGRKTPMVQAENIKLYLDYLDKEMTIMGVLSTFCIVVPLFVLERLTSAEKGFLSGLWSSGSRYFWFGLILMLLAGGLYYKQRSLLAWYYGQISLKMALPHHDTSEIETWLREADSWACWSSYNTAFYLMIAGSFEYGLGILSTNVDYLRNHNILMGMIPILGFVLFGVPQVIIMVVHQYEDNPRRACLRRILSLRSK
jgi:hypothetical protein